MTTQKKNHSTQIYMHTKKQLFFYVFYCKQCGNTIRYALIKLR